MSTTVEPLGLRLFLEGIEVPVISAQVTISPDQPAVAAIQIIPTDMSMALLPRTLVHLFYLDYRGNSDEANQAWKAQSFTQTTNRVNAPDRSYHLLFCGEILGYTYSKTSDQRQMVIQCMDLSTYWDTCYEYFSEYGGNGSGMFDQTATFSGAHVGMFNDIASGTSSVLAHMVQTPPNTTDYSNCAGLLGGLIHLLEVVGGVSPTSAADPGLNGVNDFFSVANLRYDLLGMLGAVAADDSSAKIFAQHAFYDWLLNGMTSQGNMMSFRDMLMYVNRFIFHNIYPNPCAMYVPPGSTSVNATVTIPALSSTDSGGLILSNLSTLLKGAYVLADEFGKASNSSGTNYDSAAFDFATSTLDAMEPTVEQVDTLISAITPAQAADIGSYKTKWAQIKTDFKAVQNASMASDAATNSNTLVSDLDAILGLQQQAQGASVKKPKTVAVGGHLYNQLILPETFFVSPPRCNVIFPDQYNSFQYSRNFSREITRLMCQMGSGIVGASGDGHNLLGSFTVSPNIVDVNDVALSATLGQSTRTIMPHEVHSGIVPKIEWINDGMRWNIKAGNTKSLQNKYVQRLADMQFYLHRWSSRSMSVQGIFMPGLVCGLPSVVLNRSAPSGAVIAALQKALNTQWVLPTQYVGKIVSISHSIGQQGGATSVAFAYSRAHRGIDDEFLTILNQTVTTPPGTQTDTINLKQMVQDPNSQDSLFDDWNWFKLLIRTYLSPQGLPPNTVVMGRQISSVTATGTYVIDAEDATLLSITDDLFDELSSDGQTITVPTTLAVSWVQLASPVSYNGSAVAFEDLVRPGWMQPNIWDNTHITQAVYAPLLGTSAITDDLSLNTAAINALLGLQVNQSQAPVSNAGGPGQSGTVPAQSFPGSAPYVVVSGSVEETIDGLSVVYGMLKAKDADVTSFIRQFTYRPIATITDILGSQNLTYGPTKDYPNAQPGQVSNPQPAGAPPSSQYMVEGFHSRAFGPYNQAVKFAARVGDSDQPGSDALMLLFPGSSAPGTVKRATVGDSTGTQTSISGTVDPRGRSQARVLAYIAELNVSRGLAG